MASQKTTAQLQSELNEIINWFEADNIDLDEAVKNYQLGTKLIQQLQDRLKTAQNTIIKISKV